MFSRDSRRGFGNPVHKRQTCHVPGTGMAYVIHVLVYENVQSVLYRQHFPCTCKVESYVQVALQPGHKKASLSGLVARLMCKTISAGYVISDHSSLHKHLPRRMYRMYSHGMHLTEEMDTKRKCRN